MRDILSRRCQDIDFVNFTGEDVVRHKLVQRIVNAYAEHAQAAAPELRPARAPACRVLTWSSWSARPSCAPRLSLRSLPRGIADGHLSVALVDEGRIQELNRDHRGHRRADGRAVVPGRRHGARRRAARAG